MEQALSSVWCEGQRCAHSTSLEGAATTVGRLALVRDTCPVAGDNPRSEAVTGPCCMGLVNLGRGQRTWVQPSSCWLLQIVAQSRTSLGEVSSLKNGRLGWIFQKSLSAELIVTIYHVPSLSGSTKCLTGLILSSAVLLALCLHSTQMRSPRFRA
jgi:hypothetical protein